jgi:hypothetical protein
VVWKRNSEELPGKASSVWSRSINSAEFGKNPAILSRVKFIFLRQIGILSRQRLCVLLESRLVVHVNIIQPKDGRGQFTAERVLRTRPKTYRAIALLLAEPDASVNGIARGVRRLCMQLVRPGPEHLASYVAALERGWSADNERGVEAAREELWSDDSAVALVTLEERLGP